VAKDECANLFTKNHVKGKQKISEKFSRLLATLSFHQKCSVKLKMHQMYFGYGSTPDRNPAAGAYDAPPHTLVGWG